MLLRRGEWSYSPRPLHVPVKGDRFVRPILALSLLLTLRFLVPTSWAELPGCRPTKPLMILVEDILVPILLVDELCGDPDADLDPRFDTDADRLLDAWERVWFGNLTAVSGAPGVLTDYDQDGLSDLEEWRFGLDPTADDFAVASHTDRLTYDRRGQLTAVGSQGKSVEFAYDTGGNILVITEPLP